MKRSPLSPGDKPLRRKTPMQPTSEPKTPRARPPRKTGAHAGEAEARRLVAERSTGVCELQIVGVCLGRATNFHHRQNRGRGKVGKWLASNGIHVCGSGTTGCHGAVTNTNGNRAEYERLGWIVPSWADPHTVPAVLWPMGLVYLADDGSWWQPSPDDLPAPVRDDEKGQAA